MNKALTINISVLCAGIILGASIEDLVILDGLHMTEAQHLNAIEKIHWRNQELK